MSEAPKDDGTAGFDLMKAMSSLIAAHDAVKNGAPQTILWGAQERMAKLLNQYVISRLSAS
jgi:hypothetical protein